MSRHCFLLPGHAVDVLGDPVRRRILELLADGELPSGAVAEHIREELGISRPGVSQHLRVLREGLRAEGTRRSAPSTPGGCARWTCGWGAVEEIEGGKRAALAPSVPEPGA